MGQLQSYQEDATRARARPAGKADEGRIKVLKDGRPLLRVVDVDAHERKRLTAFPTTSPQSEQRVTIVDVSEAMHVQSLAALQAKRTSQIDTDDVISIDGDDEMPRTHRLAPRRQSSVRVKDRSAGLWTVGIRAGQGIVVPVTSTQPIRLFTTATSRTGSADDSSILTKSPHSIRRNSTASVVRPNSHSQNPELTDAEREMRDELDARDRAAVNRISEAYHAGNYDETMRLVSAYRSQGRADGEPPYFTSRGYNVVLSAMQAFRQPGQPISNILTTYNEMLERDILPTIGTYSIVIQALLERDDEVDRAMKKLSKRRRWLEWEQRVFASQGEKKQETKAAADKNFAKRSAALEVHEKELEGLMKEHNYESAVKLFRAAIVYNRFRPFRVSSYLAMLAAAARRGDVETAIQVWGHHEGVKNSDQRKQAGADDRPLVRMFSLLLQAYANAREASGIKEVLQEFLEQEQQGGIVDGRGGEQDQAAVMRTVNGLFSEVLHAYILSGQTDVALGLLDEMARVTPEDALKPGSLPSLSTSAIARCVYSLATTGDFDRALQVTTDIEVKYTNMDVNERKAATKQCAQYILNEAISNANIDVLKRAVDIMPLGVDKHSTEDADAFAATIQRAVLLVANEEAYPIDTVLRLLRIFNTPDVRAEVDVTPRNGVPALVRACFERASLRDALFVLQFFDKEGHTGTGPLASDLTAHRSELIRLAADLKEALSITAMLARYGCFPSLADSLQLIKQYRTAPTDAAAWTSEQASSLITVFEGPASAVESAVLQGEEAREYDDALDHLVKDLAAATSSGLKLHSLDLGRLMNVASLRKGDERAQAIMTEAFGQDAVAPFLPSSPQLSSEAGTEFLAPSETSTAPTSVGPAYRIDKRLSYTVDGHYGPKPSMTPLASYAALKQGLAQGVTAEPFIIARLLQALARMGEESKVRELYALAHEVIATTLPEDRQLAAWIQVEDFMLIASCHLGHLEEAGMHRARIIEQGMAPSADAYATMISSTKDTTDDASVARELWEESQRYGVKPHLYLYNTIISKLSKARKAEQAIEFFKNMKVEGLKPSSVTYGAVIVSLQSPDLVCTNLSW